MFCLCRTFCEPMTHWLRRRARVVCRNQSTDAASRAVTSRSVDDVQEHNARRITCVGGERTADQAVRLHAEYVTHCIPVHLNGRAARHNAWAISCEKAVRPEWQCQSSYTLNTSGVAPAHVNGRCVIPCWIRMVTQHTTLPVCEPRLELQY